MPREQRSLADLIMEKFAEKEEQAKSAAITSVTQSLMTRKEAKDAGEVVERTLDPKVIQVYQRYVWHISLEMSLTGYSSIYLDLYLSWPIYLGLSILAYLS